MFSSIYYTILSTEFLLWFSFINCRYAQKLRILRKTWWTLSQNVLVPAFCAAKLKPLSDIYPLQRVLIDASAFYLGARCVLLLIFVLFPFWIGDNLLKTTSLRCIVGSLRCTFGFSLVSIYIFFIFLILKYRILLMHNTIRAPLAGLRPSGGHITRDLILEP